MWRRRVPTGRAAFWLLGPMALLAALVWFSRDPAQTPSPSVPVPLAELFGGGDAVWDAGETGRPLDLPADHGAHPGARSEAWWLTAALTGPDGRRFHLQFALFRLALTPDPKPRPSAWAAHQIYRAHLALTDAAGGHQLAYERLSRDALALAGADSRPLPLPLRLWLEDWFLEIGQTTDGRPSLHLRAAQDDLHLDLALTGDGLVLTQGELGLAPGAGVGMAGYLMPRLATEGTLTLSDQRVAVTGDAWLDHAWGILPLAGGQLALARFSLRLSDDRDLMCLRTSRRDGSGTPIPACTLVGPDGTRRSFERRDLTLDPQREWISPRDGTAYPVAWRLALPDVGLDLQLIPLVDAQELDLSLRLWAGGVAVTGDADGTPVAGVGHIELAGYGPQDPGK